MEARTLPWWDKSLAHAALANAACASANKIWAEQQTSALRDRILESVYEGRRDGGGGGGRLGMMASMTGDKTAPARINIIKAKGQAVASRLAAHRPFPVVSCEDGGWTERRFASKVSRILRSRIGQTDIERARIGNKSDTMVVGTGCLKVSRTVDYDVTVDQVPRSELLITPGAARRRNPRMMFHVQTMALEVAQALYAKTAAHRAALEAGSMRPSIDSDGYATWGSSWLDTDERQVVLCEGWHLPSGPLDADITDGRHVMVVHGVNTEQTDGAVLFDRPWRRRRLPFSLLHWSPPRRGLLESVGMVEDLLGVQAKVHSVHRDIQNALYHGSQLRVFVPRSSKVNKNHLLKQGDPAVIEYDGVPPQWVAPQAVHQQLFSYLEWLINLADDISGLSRDFQSGQTPLGANASGKAQLVLDDIQSERYRLFEMMESFQSADLGTLIIDEAREMALDSSISKSKLAPWIRDHNWKRVEVDSGLYHLTVEPINFIAGTRAGKLQAIEALAGAGLITDRLDAIESFDEPDMQRMYKKLLGPRHAVARLVEDLADESVDLFSLAPDSFFPIAMGREAVLSELEDAWANRVVDPILERHRQWLLMANTAEQRIVEGTTPPSAPALPAAAAVPELGPGMAPGMGAPPGGPIPGPVAPPMAMPPG